MRELIERVRAIATERDEIEGCGTSRRDSIGTFAVLAAAFCLAALTFIATGG